MTRLESAPKRTGSRKSFKTYRRQDSIKFPPSLYQEFEAEFPAYTLYATGVCSVDLIKHTDSRNFIGKSEALRSIPLAHILREVFRAYEPSAKRTLELPVERIGYRRRADNQGFNVSLLLNDEKNVLEAERDRYLEAMRALGRINIPNPTFVPEITLASVLEVPTNNEALTRLVPFIPNTVNLKPVQFNPSPFGISKPAS